MTTVLIAGMIFWFSEQSAEQSSTLSGGITKGLFSFLNLSESQLRLLHEGIRSAAHIGTFALLGFSSSLLSHSYRRQGWAIPVLVGGVAYALLDECHQLWRAAGRAFEWVDIVKDSIGVGIGIAVVALIIGVVGRRQRKGQ